MTLASAIYLIACEVTGNSVDNYIWVYLIFAELYHSWETIERYFDLEMTDASVEWMGEVAFASFLSYFWVYMVPVLGMGYWSWDIPVTAAIPLAMLFDHMNDPWMTFDALQLSFVFILQLSHIVMAAWGSEAAGGMIGGSVFI